QPRRVVRARLLRPRGAPRREAIDPDERALQARGGDAADADRGRGAAARAADAGARARAAGRAEDRGRPLGAPQRAHGRGASPRLTPAQRPVAWPSRSATEVSRDASPAAAIFPASIMCLNATRSALACRSGRRPKSFATLAPRAPRGGR